MNDPEIICFPNVTVDDIRRNINAFRETNLEGATEDEILSRILDVFGTATGSFSFPSFSCTYPKGTTFYRVRAIPKGQTTVPLSAMAVEADCWEPPAALTQAGRMNHASQPVLYTTPDTPETALAEAQVAGLDYFSLIEFTAKADVRCAQIGADRNLDKFPAEERVKIGLFYDFLDTEFMRASEQGGAHVIRGSATIANSWFDYPKHNAWAYRSENLKDRICVAFYPGLAQECLTLNGVMICEADRTTGAQMGVKFVVDFDPVTGDAQYHRIGSAAQKKLFPTIAS